MRSGIAPFWRLRPAARTGDGGQPHIGGADESARKPGSVLGQPCDWPRGDHPSGNAVADILMRSTRRLGRTALERLRSTGKPMPLDLAPGGVYRAAAVTCSAGGLLHRRFTLTDRRTDRRSVFCGTVPRVTPGGRYPPPCPVEPGLSSRRQHVDVLRSPGRLVRRTAQSTRCPPPCARCSGPVP